MNFKTINYSTKNIFLSSKRENVGSSVKNLALNVQKHKTIEAVD